MLFDHCGAQADTAAAGVVPMDLSDKYKDKKGNGKGEANATATEYFAGSCLLCKA